MKKKILLFFALIATFVCLFAITSSAVEVNGIYYTLNKTSTYENYAGTATVNSENRDKCTLVDFKIPEIVEYDNDGDGVKEKYVVTAIDSQAVGAKDYTPNQYIQTVEIPKTVATIGTHAFRKLPKLQSVVIKAQGYNPETETTKDVYLYDAEFWTCQKLETADLSQSQIVSIKQYLFASCTSLKEVKLPECIKVIGGYSFKDCTSLTKLNIPRGVEQFGGSAFWNCSFDGDIVIDNLTGLGNHAFRETNITSFIALNGTITSAGTNAEFYNCKELEYIVLPDSVTSVGEHVFTGCSSLKYIVASENITSVNTSSGVIGSIKAIILKGNNQEKLATAATAFGGTLTPFGNYDPESYPTERTIYYGVGTKDGVNYYQFTDLQSPMYMWNVTTNVKNDFDYVIAGLGYSVKEKGTVADGIMAGYDINTKALEIYEDLFGEVELGLFVANANEFTGEDFIVDGVITNDYSIQLSIKQRDYSKVNCSVVEMSTTDDIPPLVFALYVIDENNNVTYIQKQYEQNPFENKAIAGTNSLCAVTLAEVQNLLLQAQPVAITKENQI